MHGIGLKCSEVRSYKANKQCGLENTKFPIVLQKNNFTNEDNDKVTQLINLVKMQVDIFTARQGTADWHIDRQFSFTSYQAD